MGAPAGGALSSGKARPLSRLCVRGRPTPWRALHGWHADRSAAAPPGISVSLSGLSLPRSRLSRRHPPITSGGARLVGVAPEGPTISGVSRMELPSFTRLALQLFLVKGFKLYSFQLQGPKEPCISIYCHYLAVSALGNLRACCLPWMW
jgi:hypothetical protein